MIQEIDSKYNGVMSRAVGRSENPGLPVLFGGLYLPFLGEIRLTDLPKSGGARATPGDDRPDEVCKSI